MAQSVKQIVDDIYFDMKDVIDLMHQALGDDWYTYLWLAYRKATKAALTYDENPNCFTNSDLSYVLMAASMQTADAIKMLVERKTFSVARTKALISIYDRVERVLNTLVVTAPPGAKEELKRAQEESR